jgi:WhiB family redox-sensing transcriptional regulator
MNHTEDTSPLYVDLPSLKFIAADSSWRIHSACADHFDIFFDWKRVAEAKAVCDTCSVKEQCLEFAVKNDERDGVWGGLTAKERKAL